jgi:hypothetical protein
MKSMKFILSSMILGFAFIICAQPQFQNNIWTLPSQYRNFDNALTLSLPYVSPSEFGYQQGTLAKCASNAMQDANGDLLFFIVDDEIYDKDGYTIGLLSDKYANSISPSPSTLFVNGTSEITIVPNPVNCSQFYIFMAGRLSYNSASSKIPVVALLDMSQQTDVSLNSGKMGNLLYCHSIQSTLPSSAPNILEMALHGQGVSFFAASKETNFKRFVFVSTPAHIFRFIINANGFQYDGNIQFRDYTDPSTDYIVNNVYQLPYRGEMELIEVNNNDDIKYRIAVSMPMRYNNSVNNASSVYYANLDAQGELTPDQNGVKEDLIQYMHNTTVFNNLPHIHGIEFSPDGNILYITHQWNNTYMNSFDYFDFNNTSAGAQPVPGVTNTESRNFEYSQIEIGNLGKLYLAYSGGLATFSNPNTPNSGVFNLTAHPFNYSSNTEGTSSNKESLISYMLPDQIDGMDYSSIGYPSIYTVAGYTAGTSATWQPIPNQNPWGVSNSDIAMQGDLIIPSGVNVVIKNMTFRFAPEAKVIIEQGAKLTLDNTVFTNMKLACDDSEAEYWQGVQVYGTRLQHQYPQNNPTYQGMLELKNRATIEFAHKAVANWKEGSYNTRGGVIKSNNGIFRNNRIAVELMLYRNFNPYNSSVTRDNTSSFTNTSFFSDDDYIEGQPKKWLTILWRVQGVNFKNCHFANNLTSNKSLSSSPSQGLIAIDASFKVIPACDSPPLPYGTPCPSNLLLKSSFTGLEFGIQTANTGSSQAATITQSDFINNNMGIYVDEFDNININRNDFHIGNSGYMISPYPGNGITIDNATGFIIEENSVLSNLTGGKTSGIVVNNSGTADNQVYKNSLNNLYYGTQANKVNRFSDVSVITGLQFLCNDYNQNSTAISINYPGLGEGVRQYQGDLNPLTSAGNTFQLNSMDIANNSSTINYYHSGGSAQPNSVSGLVNPISGAPLNTCPTSFTSGISMFSQLVTVLSDYETELVNHETAYNILNYNYISLIDNGNTDILQSQIENNWSSDAWTLRNNLMQEAPYLSSDALLTAAAENILPNAMLLEVLLANPDATKGEHFISELNDVTNNTLPEYMLNYVRNNWDTETVRTTLEGEMAYYRSEIANTNNFIKYLEKTKDEHTYAERHATVLKGEGISNRIGLMDFFIENNEWTRADSVLQALNSDESLEGDLGLLEDFDNYITFRSNLGVRNIAELNSSEISYLETLAEKGSRASGYAENILCFFYDICYDKEVSEGGGMAKMLTIPTPSGDAPSLEELMYNITVYPNPASEFTSIKWEIYDELENAQYKIFDLNGREMGSGIIEENTGEKVIDTRSLENGVYIINIYNDGIMKMNSKLIVSKEK